MTKLTPEQVDLLRDSYAWKIVDDMDVKDLMESCALQIANELMNVEQQQLIAEITEMYDEDTAQDLINKVINHTK
jgi:transcriptional regulator of aromatic amino acid metabolism